jgi:hypothetical protein
MKSFKSDYVEVKIKKNKNYLTCKYIYKAIASSINKNRNLGTVIRFIKNKNIIKNSGYP